MAFDVQAAVAGLRRWIGQFESVLAPGEPEYLREQERSATGVPLDQHVWEELQSLKEKK